MKKLIALMLALTMALGLCACGGSSGSDAGKGGTSAAEPAASTSESDVSEGDASAAEPATAGEMKSGDTGDGPADLDCDLFSVTIPQRLKYEISSFFISDDDTKYGTVAIDLGSEDSSYVGELGTLTITTQRMPTNQKEAVESTIKLLNLDTYDEGKSELGAEVTYGGYTYQTINTSTEFGKKDFLVTFFLRAPEGEFENDVVAELKVNPEKIAIDDPQVAELMNSLVLKERK